MEIVSNRSYVHLNQKSIDVPLPKPAQPPLALFLAFNKRASVKPFAVKTCLAHTPICSRLSEAVRLIHAHLPFCPFAGWLKCSTFS